MRYLYRPTEPEEVIVRGRYEFVTANGVGWATEEWERYRNEGTPVQTWRSEWGGERDGQRFRVLAHSVVTPEGMERLKLRLNVRGGSQQNLTLTFMPDSIFVHDNDEFKDVALPPYGLVAPQPSLARFAFPFDLASRQRELAMTFLVRLPPDMSHLQYRATKFAYTPLGLQDFTIKRQTIRTKGWRMEVPGLPAQEGWFDRNGTCLRWHVEAGKASWEARLVDWMRFG